MNFLEFKNLEEPLVNEITKYWPGAEWIDSSNDKSDQEAELLKLNCDKAFHTLGWEATMNFEETAHWTCKWYRTFYEKNSSDAANLTIKQIKDYLQLAKERNSFRLV